MSNGRLEALRRLLDHVHRVFALEFGFLLWDGSMVPANWPRDGLCVRIADEGVVAGLVRRPESAERSRNLWAAARLDIRNGTIFDLVARTPLGAHARHAQDAQASRFSCARRPRTSCSRRAAAPGRSRASATGRQRRQRAENKKNISYHYDVSNAFYELWLDPEMVYSCSYFTRWENSLAQAQIDKLEMCCRRLRLKPGETVLDVGCGWGAFSIYAAKHYGVRGYGVTCRSSRSPTPRRRSSGSGSRTGCGSSSRTTRPSTGSSTRSFPSACAEHVGSTISRPISRRCIGRCGPGGLFLHHAITRPGKSRQAHKRQKRPEFAALTKYIFPGRRARLYRTHRDQSRDASVSRFTMSKVGASIISAPADIGMTGCFAEWTRRCARSAR